MMHIFADATDDDRLASQVLVDGTYSRDVTGKASEVSTTEGLGQDQTTAALNASFFATDHHGETIASLDTHRNIRTALDREVEGVERLLDVGNGGVFEFDTNKVGSIVAVDLFLEDLPAERWPANVEARNGDALALAEPEGSFDAVVHSFVFHHLVGTRPDDLIENIRGAISEAKRMLKPGGRLIVGESCVPHWFFRFERLAFRPLVHLSRTRLLGGHPPAMQLPPEMLESLVSEQLEIERCYRIPHGRWITQFGHRWPTLLTPARPWMVVARKPGESSRQRFKRGPLSGAALPTS